MTKKTMEQINIKKEGKTPIEKSTLECDFDTESSPELKKEIKERTIDDIAFEHITLSHDFNSVLDFCDDEKTKDILSSMEDFTVKDEPLEADTDIETRNPYRLRKRSIVNMNVDVRDEEFSDTDDDGNISLIDRDKLRLLRINLIHSVPPQHKVESTAGTHAPTQEQKQLFEAFGPIKIGKFSIEEDKILRNNWETFCKLHEWNPQNVEPFLQMRHKNRYLISSLHERKKFVQFLGNGLPWRTLYSVYCRFKNMHMQYNNTKYSIREDEAIISHLEQRKNASDLRILELEKMLNRSRCSINRRRRKLKSLAPKKWVSLENFKFTEPTLIKYIKTLLKVTGSDDIQELKDATIPKVVWQKMASIMKMDYEILRKFWFHQLHMQLFSPRPIYLNDIKILLIEYMYGKGISNRRNIIWTNIVHYFEGMTAPFLRVIFNHMVEKVESIIGVQSNIDTVIEYMHKYRIHGLVNQMEDKFLPRLSYKNQRIEILDQQMEC